MFTFLLVVHGLIAAALVGVILVQKSEGGGLGMGSGGPSGLMTARGAADFLTRATTILAALFILMALALAAYASMRNAGGDIDTSLAHQAAPGPINAPTTPTSAIPMMGATPAPAPTSAAPDSLTPAPAGPPSKAAEPAPKAVAVPPVSHLRTIDTHVGGTRVGINGIGTGSGNTGDSAVKPVAAIKAPSPAKADTTPAAPAGNSTQP